MKKRWETYRWGKVRELSVVLWVTYTSKTFSVMGNIKATEVIFSGAQLVGVS